MQRRTSLCLLPLFASAALSVASTAFVAGNSKHHWGSVQPGNINAMESGTEFCGVGDTGVYCSEN